MAFSSVEVFNSVKQRSVGFKQSGRTVCRDSTGRLWTVWSSSTGSKTKGAYSDDDGDTWSAAEEFVSHGGSAALPLMLTIDKDDRPMLVLIQGTTLRIYHRTAAATWTTRASQGITLQDIGFTIIQTDDGDWYLCYVDVSSSINRFVIKRSTDDLATFSNTYTLNMHAVVRTGNSVRWVKAFDGVMDTSEVIHLAGGPGWSTDYHLVYATFDTATNAFSAVTDIHASGAVADAMHQPSAIRICVDDADKPHIIAHWGGDTNPTIYQAWHTTLTASWSTPALVRGTEASTNDQFVDALYARIGTDIVALMSAKGYGTNSTTFNVVQYVYTGSWSAGTAIRDSSTDATDIGISNNSATGYGRVEAGVFCCYYQATNRHRITKESTLAWEVPGGGGGGGGGAVQAASSFFAVA